MNKYLEKIAISEENKSTLRTFAESTAASIPAKIGGAAIGGYLGNRYLKGFSAKVPKFLNASGKVHFSGGAIGTGLGAELASGAAEIAAIKHSLHNKVKEN